MKVGKCNKVGEICSNCLTIVQKMQNMLSVQRPLGLNSACEVEESINLPFLW